MTKKYYAIVGGNNKFNGVVDDWELAEPLIIGAKGVLHKSFRDFLAAQTWVNMNKKEVKEETKMKKEISVNVEGLNDSQKAAVETFVSFMESNELCMSLSGYAGTGKTFTLSRISEAMKAAGIPVAFIAPTNKAVVVMAKNGIDAQTVHKFVYEWRLEGGTWKQSRKDGREFHNGLIVMDESSMANDQILSDLESYARKAMCKILYVGDPGQLPPVGKNNQRKVFEEFSFKAELTQVMRQGEGSRILDLATAIRNGNMVVPSNSDKDVAVTTTDKAFQNYIEKVKGGMDTTFICWTNSSRISLNLRARNALGIKGKPQNGEKFIAINNTERYANGEEFSELGAYVGSVEVDGANGYVYEAPNAGLNVDKEYILIIPAFKDASFGLPKCVTGEMAHLFEGHSSRNGYFYTPSRGIQLVVATFAYAITGHKSQGSQWDYVFVDDCSKYEAQQWFYTVVTRASKGLVITNSVKLRSASWNEIEIAAYGSEITPAQVEAPVHEVKTVARRWAIKRFENYGTFAF